MKKLIRTCKDDVDRLLIEKFGWEFEGFSLFSHASIQNTHEYFSKTDAFNWTITQLVPSYIKFTINDERLSCQQMIEQNHATIEGLAKDLLSCDLHDEDVYCPRCGACGESNCCKPTMCDWYEPDSELIDAINDIKEIASKRHKGKDIVDRCNAVLENL